MVGLVDTALNGDFDAEEACRFLKVGLLCTQDSPKLRPSMSKVVKLLTGEIEVKDRKITKPGVITDFMDLKIRGPQKATKPQAKDNDTTSSYNLPSASDKLGNSTMTTESSATHTITTFTAPYDQSIEAKDFSV